MRVADDPAQIPFVLLATIEIVGIGFTVTLKTEAELVPQALLAVTDILPPVVPDIAVIEFVVPPAVCVHPDGNVQL